MKNAKPGRDEAIRRSGDETDHGTYADRTRRINPFWIPAADDKRRNKTTRNEETAKDGSSLDLGSGTSEKISLAARCLLAFTVL